MGRNKQRPPNTPKPTGDGILDSFTEAQLDDWTRGGDLLQRLADKGTQRLATEELYRESPRRPSWPVRHLAPLGASEVRASAGTARPWRDLGLHGYSASSRTSRYAYGTRPASARVHPNRDPNADTHKTQQVH